VLTACGIMHPRCCRSVTSWVHYTTSCNTQPSAPEDGWDQRPKHVELVGIINKPLLFNIVGVCIICMQVSCSVEGRHTDTDNQTFPMPRPIPLHFINNEPIL